MLIIQNIIKNYRQIKTELIKNFQRFINGFVNYIRAFNYNFPKKNHPKKGGFLPFRSPVILEEELTDFV